MLEVFEIMNLGPFAMNCYLLVCKENGAAVVIDPGDESSTILKVIARQKVSLEAIYLTHTHLDHVMAVEDVMQSTGAKLYLPKEDEQMYVHLKDQCRMFGLPEIEPCTEYTTFTEKDSLTVGRKAADILWTPGHSPGSCSFFFKEERLLFSGDLLFFDSIGRTDLFGGDMPTMQESLARIAKLPPDTRVFPGHGPTTTIGRERQHNPFLIGLG